jgi:hypothetical protein
MKRLLLTGLLSLAAVAATHSQTADYYVNNGTVSSSIAIDAINFVNNGLFSISTFAPFDFTNVRNYTNRNVMQNEGSGFIFDTAPTSGGVRYSAANFVNASLIPNVGNASVSGGSYLRVSATNIINRGTLSIGQSGLLSLEGGNVDVSRSAFQVGALTDRTPNAPGEMYDQYWGFGTNRLMPEVNLLAAAPNTPSHVITNFFPQGLVNVYFRGSATMFLTPPGLSSAQFIMEVGTNRTVQIVFVRNANTNITTEIKNFGNTEFDLGIPSVTWNAVGTNAFGQVITNSLYLTDTYGANPTNGYITNFPFATPQSLGLDVPPETYQPQNFSITRTQPFEAVLGDTGEEYSDPGASFWGTNSPPIVVNVQYSAYQIAITNITPTANVITNTRTGPGRVEITANQALNLNLTRIQGLNYVAIKGTNHFDGATNGSISSAYADISLVSTNGTLTASGLFNPVVPQLSGTITLYSAVWSNLVSFGGSTNPVAFHVLFVDSQLNSTTAPQVFDLALRSTNLFIGDTYRVVNGLTLDADQLTILTNGFVNILNPQVNWSDGVTHLQSLTNLGLIAARNALYFVSRNADGSDRPYATFVNRGAIAAVGNTINADYFENSGTINSFSGPIFIQAGSSTVLSEAGTLSAASSDIVIKAGDFTATNHNIRPGRSLSLIVSGAMKTGTNAWGVGDGFNLLTKPASGGLQFTTVTNVASPYQNVFNQWAGEDRGANLTGYTDNGALGRLILIGSNFSSLFTYQGTGGGKALYVHEIDFLDYATNRNNKYMTALQIDSNLVIYYQKAVIGTNDVSGELDGYNGGRLRYVGNNVGSSTPWPDATDLGGGWMRSSWFGDFNVANYPWIYHAQHGWMYTFGADPTSIWLWTQDMGFVWTGSGVYPWLWRNQDSTWLYYVKGSQPPRQFFNWNKQQWESRNP